MLGELPRRVALKSLSEQQRERRLLLLLLLLLLLRLLLLLLLLLRLPLRVGIGPAALPAPRAFPGLDPPSLALGCLRHRRATHLARVTTWARVG